MDEIVEHQVDKSREQLKETLANLNDSMRNNIEKSIADCVENAKEMQKIKNTEDFKKLMEKIASAKGIIDEEQEKNKPVQKNVESEVIEFFKNVNDMAKILLDKAQNSKSKMPPTK
jgi:hypothetical protein